MLPNMLLNNRDKVELFDDFIAGRLDESTQHKFEIRLKADKAFADDFTAYLLAFDAIYREEREDCIEFANAMKNISKNNLEKLIGKDKVRPNVLSAFKRRFAWASGIAALFIVGFFTMLGLYINDQRHLDDVIVEYNDVYGLSKGGEDITTQDLSPEELEAYYLTVPKEDIQEKQIVGLKLAMSYLKKHERSRAIKTLQNLKEEFSDDQFFVAKCDKLISQIK